MAVMNVRHIVILVTTKDEEEAEKIARRLLEEKLVACANVTRGVKSLFWWDGKIDEASEALMVLKSREDFLPEIIETVKALHSYDVPEVLALPAADGNKDYLKWIDESVKQVKERENG